MPFTVVLEIQGEEKEQGLCLCGVNDGSNKQGNRCMSMLDLASYKCLKETE